MENQKRNLKYALLFTIFCLLITSCKKNNNFNGTTVLDPQTTLVGTWKFKRGNVYMKINGRSYTHYLETQLGMSQAAVNKMLLKVKKAYLDEGTISFNSDGSYTQETGTGINKSGKWVLEANNQLTLIGDWEEDGKVYTITVLNKDKLQLFAKYDYKKYMHGKHEHDEIKVEVVRTFIKNE